VIAVLVATATLILLARPIHDQLLAWVGAAEPLIRRHPTLGMATFVALAAISALLAFFSSALLLPVAVYAWGPVTCMVLLWIGWLLGGIVAYLVGRYLGRPVVRALLRPGTLARYEGWARTGAGFMPVFLLQLAIPSDVTGYVLGLVRCRLRVFLPALAAAEVPYAIGAVYLGASFLQRNPLPLIALGAAGALLSFVAARVLRGRGTRHRPPPHAPDPPRREHDRG
jgi:uncharacterized membrane protein YdjX (TVP38/TMEM64 family)